MSQNEGPRSPGEGTKECHSRQGQSKQKQESVVASNHTVLGILVGILVSTLVLSFQMYLFFTGVNTKDHRPQSCYFPALWAQQQSQPQVRES